MGVVNTVLPVFLIIVVGVLLRKFDFFSADFAEALTRLVYYVALPCLLFYKMAAADFSFSQAGKTYLFIVLGMLGCIGVGYITAVLLKLPSSSAASFVQGAFRGNLAYIGLAVVMYCNNSGQGQVYKDAPVIAALVLGMTVPVYNIAAVIVLLGGKQKLTGRAWLRVVIETARNPLVISSVLGIVYSVTVGSLPSFADRSLAALAEMALPLALFSIGASLAAPIQRGKIVPAVLSSVIKVGFAPVIGLLLLMLLDMSPAERLVAMVFLACPTAVSSHVYSLQLAADEKLSASIVVTSTLLSIVSLSLAVTFF